MIVRAFPDSGLDQAELAWFESDAPTNIEAIKEIDAEASMHGLVRSREYSLPVSQVPDGRVVRRGICHRLEHSDLPEHLAQRRGSRVLGPSSAEIIHSTRDGA